MMLNKGIYNNGKGRGTKIFEASTVELFTKKVTGLPYNNTRALGWDTVPNQQHKPCGDCFSPDSFGHTGYTGTSVWADKQKNLGIIILTNRVYPDDSDDDIVYYRTDVSNAICKAMGYMKEIE